MSKAIQWSDLELVKELGEGHAGVVFLAKLKCDFRELPLGSDVAVKRYKSWILEQPGQYERIIRELELGRNIQHPNLVKTLSIIADPDGRPALVMAYCDGETLESCFERIRREKLPIDWNKANASYQVSYEARERYFDDIWNKEKHIDLDFAFKIVGDLASAIAAIHETGAIHRDIKPANIILSNDGPILMDFGVMTSKDFPEQTTSGEFLGTIRYAAPEYLFGETYDSSIDVYSLGAVAYELFGEQRFPSEETEWARLVANKRDYVELYYPPIKRHYGMDVAEFIEFILQRMLTDRERRVLDMPYLSEVIKSRLWRGPLYVDNGVLVKGEPRVTFLGELGNRPKSDLRNVVKDLKRKLSTEDRALLRRLLTPNYDDYSKFKNFSDRELEFILEKSPDRLKAAGCLVAHPDVDESTPSRYRVHEAIVAAYRYGYL
jgi:serine/threonine protein kinase